MDRTSEPRMVARRRARMRRANWLTLAVVAGALSSGEARAASGEDYLPHPDFQRVPYTGPSVSPHEGQVYNLFLPRTPRPPTGYPVVLDLNISGFRKTFVLDRITPDEEVLYFALESGIAVISLSATVTHDVEPDQAGPYRGNGLFIPPSFRMPADFDGPVHPYFDPKWPMAHKDAVMMVQHARHHASDLQIDADRLVLCGASAGANTWMWVAFGPDRSNLWINPRGQEVEPTHVHAGLLRLGGVYFPAMKQTFGGHLFPDRNSGPTYDRPAATLADTFVGCQVGASALFYAQKTDPVQLASTRTLLVYREPPTSTDFEIHPPEVPGTEELVHTAWSGFAWKLFHPQSRLVLTNTDIARGIEDIAVDDRNLMVDEMKTHLCSTTGVDPVKHWTNLGHAISGFWGRPALDARGAFERRKLLTWDIANVKPSAFGTFFIGVEPAYQPHHCGLLGPLPLQTILIRVSGSGNAQIQGFLPDFPTDWASIFVQGWFVDVSADTGCGYTATPILHGYGWLTP